MVSDIRWLAAVISPQLVARSEHAIDMDVASPEGLAALVRGRAYRSVDEREPNPLMAGVQRLMDGQTIHQAIPEMIDLLSAVDSDDSDLACRVAIGLVISSAAAEVEDFELVFRLLGEQLEAVESSGEQSAALLSSALLNQLALRSRDAGHPYLAFARRSLMAMQAFVDTPPNGLAPDSIAMSVSKALLAAAASHFGFMREEGLESPQIERAVRAMRGGNDPVRDRYLARTGETYSSFLASAFNDRFRTNTWVFGGPQHADLFHDTLELELSGHADVYPGRKALATLRLVQSATGAVEVDGAECLRLLRHGGALSELELALRWFRSVGPLGAIAQDARQIMARRTEAALLRTPELHVLRDAAEVLTSGEAYRASQAVLELLRTGVPSHPPGLWQIEAQRLELAWVCLAALSWQSGLASDVSDLLFARLEGVIERSLEDDGIARALRRIAWEEIPEHSREAWIGWARNTGRGSTAASVVLSRASIGPEVGAFPDSLDAVADAINSTVRGVILSDAQLAQAGALVRSDMMTTREQAGAGMYSMGGHASSDLAAAMVVVLGVHDLWADLSEFLLDHRVAREHRSAALDRLTGLTADLPRDVAERFTKARDSLLFRSDASIADTTISPYPAGLRFLAAHGLITEIETISYVTELAASADTVTRREGAKTVERLSARSPAPWTSVLALQLSHDADSEVQSCAARSLARIAMSNSDESLLGIRRVRELLNVDGLLIPLAAIRAIKGTDQILPSDLRSALEGLASDHPSSLIRKESEELIRRQLAE